MVSAHSLNVSPNVLNHIQPSQPRIACLTRRGRKRTPTPWRKGGGSQFEARRVLSQPAGTDNRIVVATMMDATSGQLRRHHYPFHHTSENS
jgi:hypothetical protein